MGATSEGFLMGVGESLLGAGGRWAENKQKDIELKKLRSYEMELQKIEDTKGVAGLYAGLFKSSEPIPEEVANNSIPILKVLDPDKYGMVYAGKIDPEKRTMRLYGGAGKDMGEVDWSTFARLSGGKIKPIDDGKVSSEERLAFVDLTARRNRAGINKTALQNKLNESQKYLSFVPESEKPELKVTIEKYQTAINDIDTEIAGLNEQIQFITKGKGKTEGVESPTAKSIKSILANPVDGIAFERTPQGLMSGSGAGNITILGGGVRQPEAQAPQAGMAQSAQPVLGAQGMGPIRQATLPSAMELEGEQLGRFASSAGISNDALLTMSGPDMRLSEDEVSEEYKRYTNIIMRMEKDPRLKAAKPDMYSKAQQFVKAVDSYFRKTAVNSLPLVR